MFQVDYYIEATDADNHAVREAACACIAELGAKVSESFFQFCFHLFAKHLSSHYNITLVFLLSSCPQILNIFKVILYPYLILKKMNERITDS